MIPASGSELSNILCLVLRGQMRFLVLDDLSGLMRVPQVAPDGISTWQTCLIRPSTVILLKCNQTQDLFPIPVGANEEEDEEGGLCDLEPVSDETL